MADAVTVQKLLDGPKWSVIRLTNVSDGTGEAAVLKVDVSTLAGDKLDGTPSDLRIEKIQYATQGMGVDLLWDADADVLAVAIPADGDGCLDFRSVGGLRNNAGAGKTGDIRLTTVGHSVGDRYDITLHLSKAY
jgi:hypothetical protein